MRFDCIYNLRSSLLIAQIIYNFGIWIREVIISKIKREFYILRRVSRLQQSIVMCEFFLPRFT